MRKINISQQQKIQISLEDSSQSVEIGNTAIEAGFLKKLPGASLAIFLYLVTHIGKNGYILSNPTIICSYLPYNLSQIKQGLKYLGEKGFIKIDDYREGDYTYRIYIKFDQLSLEKNNNIMMSFQDKQKLRQNIIDKKTVAQQELQRALLSFIPNDKNPDLIDDDIKQWLTDFEDHLLQELIRRVNKWQQSYSKSEEKVFYYLQGIIDDWYKKEIFTYDRLKKFDKLYRETREIAATYGLKQWQNINHFQIETFQSWLNDDFPLSTSVVKFAIKSAVKRKRDGKPSLQYIEDNYIIPWKKAGIRNIQEAKKFIQNQRFYTTNNTNQSAGNQKHNKHKKDADNDTYSWNHFPWKIEQLNNN